MSQETLQAPLSLPFASHVTVLILHYDTACSKFFTGDEQALKVGGKKNVRLRELSGDFFVVKLSFMSLFELDWHISSFTYSLYLKFF